MALLKNYILLLTILSAGIQQAQQFAIDSDDAYYTAGVVEFNPSSASNLNALEHVQDNLKDYLAIISSNAAQSTDLIIFPEMTLNNVEQATFVPDPVQQLVLCDSPNASVDYQDFLIAVSCAAKSAKKYIVINLTEKQTCSSNINDPRPCASNDLNIYNTNVVLDRNGAVVSRYRKVHLYGEPKNTTFVQEFGFFDTDFGVRFGHFVCFDILFYAPAQDMVNRMGIKDFIFTTMWFGQLPFLTGVQIQQSWAYANDVNLLAAGASNPAVGSTGTGIYNGRKGPLVAVMNQRAGERKLYVAQVPRYANSRSIRSLDVPSTHARTVDSRLNQADIFLKRDYIENYASEIIDLSTGNSLQRQLCYNSTFCCHFDLQWQYLENVPDNSQYYTYRLGAYDGWRNEEAAEMNQLKNCAIFSCIGPTIEDCGKIFEADVLVRSNVAFDSILIEGSFPKARQFLLMPNSLRENLMPLAVNNFEWNTIDEGNVQTVRFLLNTTTDDLLAFSIYGNYYEERVENGDGDGATTATLASILLVLVVGLTVILNA